MNLGAEGSRYGPQHALTDVPEEGEHGAERLAHLVQDLGCQFLHFGPQPAEEPHKLVGHSLQHRDNHLERPLLCGWLSLDSGLADWSSSRYVLV